MNNYAYDKLILVNNLFKKSKAIVSIILVQNILHLMAIDASEQISRRLPNKKRKRDHFETIVSSLSDKEFNSATGLSREIFNYLLFKLTQSDFSNRIFESYQKAINSSGSPITLACKLYIHQRLCRGADVHEFLMYSIDTTHIWDYIWFPLATRINSFLITKIILF